MTLKLSAVALTVWGVAMLIADVTSPAAYAVLVALGGVFAVTALIDHRRIEAEDRAAVERMIERTRR